MEKIGCGKVLHAQKKSFPRNWLIRTLARVFPDLLAGRLGKLLFLFFLAYRNIGAYGPCWVARNYENTWSVSLVLLL